MAADKDKMLSNANYYAGLIKEAKEACAEAKSSLVSAQSTVQENWQGEAGGAMDQALQDLAKEINTIWEGLQSLEGKMRKQAQNIYDNWPEEEDIVT